MKEVNAPDCERKDSLIAFLYGELDSNESQPFQRHLRDCVACRTELADFEEVRESVVAWRNETLGTSTALLPVPAVERPSALVALRQFFNLSPLWLKGSVAFAAILFCLFAGLAVARLRLAPEGPKVLAPIPAEAHDNGYSQQQVDAIVAQRVKDELDRIKQSQERSPGTSVIAGSEGAPHRHVSSRAQEVATNAKARRPLSKSERQQLAADLRLVSARNENEFDLLDDGINQ